MLRTRGVRSQHCPPQSDDSHTSSLNFSQRLFITCPFTNFGAMTVEYLICGDRCQNAPSQPTAPPVIPLLNAFFQLRQFSLALCD